MKHPDESTHVETTGYPDTHHDDTTWTTNHQDPADTYHTHGNRRAPTGNDATAGVEGTPHTDENHDLQQRQVRRSPSLPIPAHSQCHGAVSTDAAQTTGSGRTRTSEPRTCIREIPHTTRPRRIPTPQHHAPVQPQPRLQHSTHRRTATETPNPTKHEPSLIPTQKQTERKPHTRTNNNSARQQNPVPKPYSKTARPHNNNGARRPPWTSARRGPEDGLDWA